MMKSLSALLAAMLLWAGAAAASPFETALPQEIGPRTDIGQPSDADTP